MQFTPSDLEILEAKNIEKEDIKHQLQTFKKGIPHVKIIDYAKVDEGIVKITDEKKKYYSNLYDNANIKVVKFTPSSGAATRMFKAVHSFFNSIDLKDDEIEKALQQNEHKIVQRLIKGLDKLSFYKEALQVAPRLYPEYSNSSDLVKQLLILKSTVDKNGLNLDKYPKGLIPFHDYKDTILNPFIEHLEESKNYAKKNGQVVLNFSISNQHQDKFKSNLKDYLKSSKHDDTDFQVSFSFQESSTDTIAVHPDNTLFRDKVGKFVFRPGGHGALIHNLNQIDADIIFIKNIDNVSKRDTDKQDTIAYKKVLAGFLISIQNQVFQYQRALKQSTDKSLIDECRQFMMQSLNIKNPTNSTKEIIEELHKPIRICGMVKNDGDPGGGPFWIDDDGKISLQIVETSQIDKSQKEQSDILENATHFNPVDLVCGVKDYQGHKFDLEKYINPERGFITEKSVEGNTVKALELPGLWNGAMEYWHSIFVEVPISTFNPVKTVADLLKPAHQDN